MKLDFRLWYEDERLLNQNVQSQANESAVDDYVMKSSNDTYCALLVNKFLKLGRNVIEEIHSAPISGNLLSRKDDRLGAALTVYDSVNRARFKFFPLGKEAGKIWLRFPPVIFGQKDRILLKSILIHELQHADDWASGRFQPSTADSYEFNLEQYLNREEEARGLYVQLRYLLKRIGNVEEVVKLLSGPSPFGMNEELIPVATEFLNHFKNLGEGLGSLLMPLAAAGSMVQPGIPEIPKNSANQEPPAAVYNIQREQVRNAATAVNRLLRMFLFSQYVVAPGKKI